MVFMEYIPRRKSISFGPGARNGRLAVEIPDDAVEVEVEYSHRGAIGGKEKYHVEIFYLEPR